MSAPLRILSFGTYDLDAHPRATLEPWMNERLG